MNHKKDSRMLHKIEHAIDAAIPYLLVALIVITSIDMFYAEMAEQYAFQIGLIDEIIISLFVIDLLFKYRRAQNFPKFLKKNWIDIIAVMPFYMMFRLVDEFILASEVVRESQQTLHIAEGIEKEAATAAKDIKGAKMITRSERMLRELRVLSRVPRFAKAARFFEKPKHLSNSLN
ncbi:MAG: ion transporter [Nanoarchaeota archaeon]|nr:ion transporter [Nanoarchaeota archaeon]